MEDSVVTEGRAPQRRRTAWLRGLLAAGAVLAGGGASLISTDFDAQPRVERLGGNLPVNPGAGDLADFSGQNSPTIVRSPVDAANLAVANRIDALRYSCALHVSEDGGESWSQRPIPAPSGEEPKCFAPEPAFGADGTLYLSYITLKGNGNVPNAAWMIESKDKGRSFSKPVKTLGPLAFQVRLMADPERPRRLYRTWLAASEVGLYRFTEPGNPLRFARSDDGGRTWGRAVRVSAPSHRRAIAPSLGVGPDGELYVLYLDLGEDQLDYGGAHNGKGGPPYPGPWKLILARSEDDGASWEESVVEERLVPTERFIVFIPPLPSLAVDSESGRLYAGFHDGRSGDPDVRVWSSGDGGSSWEGSVRVNDTRERDGAAQYLPKLAVAPGGRLDVVYYDRRSDPKDIKNEVSLQSSFDGGESFGASLRISDRPFSSKVGFGSERGLPDIGSRMALLSTDRRALAVWTDTRAGTEGSGKQDLAQAVVAFSEPKRLSDPVRYGLRYGGLALALAGLVALATLAIRSRSRTV